MGQYINRGYGKWETTFNERGDETMSMFDEYYNMFGLGGIAKSAGTATYSYNGADNGYFNPIYGKYITAAMFMNDNVFTCLGAKPYNIEGVRIATEAATYGVVEDQDTATMLGLEVGDFAGLGAETIPDGSIGKPVMLPVSEFREPNKDLPLPFNYGMYLDAVENKDDVSSKQDYMDKIARNYSDLADKTLLRPIYQRHPVMNGFETTMDSISRVLSSSEENGKTYTIGGQAKTITDGMTAPFGGLGTVLNKGDFYTYRTGGAKNNLDARLVDANGATLADTSLMRKLYRKCQVNWDDSGSPNNKVFFMSNVAQDLLGAVMEANHQTLFNTVYVQRDFNGVKTVPGRDAGLVLRSYNNIPIIQSGNINFDYDAKCVSDTRMGDIFLVDLDHIWISMLTPVQLWTVNNPAITGILQEKNVLHMRMNTRVDSFIQHGRITNMADDIA